MTFANRFRDIVANRFSSDRRWIVQITLIVLAGAVVYSNTLHVQFVLDDYAGINAHGPRKFLEILLHGGPRRVADLSIAVNYRLHGLQVAGYHLVNAAIHLSAAVALYFLIASALAALRQSFPCRLPDAEDTGFIDRFVPLAAALLFVVHPVQTQAVTYIIQRYTSLATLLYLLSALFFIRARLAYERGGRGGLTLLTGGLAFVAGLLALGSKQIAATLPLMLIMLEISLFRGRLLGRRLYLACGVLTLLALGLLLAIWHDRPLDEFLVMLNEATAEDHVTGRTTYFLTQLRVVATYLRLLCVPLGQSLFYDYPVYRSLFSLPVMAALLLHASLITTAVLLFRRSRRDLLVGSHPLGELRCLAALGIGWFYIAMIVESSIFPITDRIFEHRIYLPSAGFFMAAVAATAASVRNRRAAWTLLTVTCLILGSLAFARNLVWGDTLVLWQDTVRKAPNKDLAHANLAGEYMKLKMPEKALPHYVRALELKPDFHARTKVYLGKTLLYLNMDFSRFTTGEELASYGRGELDREDRTKLGAITYNNLGLAYEHLGEPAKAAAAYHDALRIDPAYYLAWYNLGLLSASLGDRAQVATALMQLRRLKPYLAESLASAVKK